ncbi:uncharacterized protein DNG_06168 [Cephalotrichum gorgonifer]|uniref:RRM domain-containing protein n=1 Tax=Cephalotrichum gorgonifer TaxID=2041049 RepID=A0AAE8MZE7_9PEZI|nr:uncharacterized protein DNG_06168 [Cephalotrichum gorgonifer]
MAVETRSRGKGPAPKNGKANGKPKVDDSKKRKAPEEPVVEKSKKIRQAKADKEVPAASTDATSVPAKPTAAPAKSPKNKKKAKKATAVVEEPEVEEEIPEPTPAETEDAAGSEIEEEEEEEEDNTVVQELAAEIGGDDDEDAAAQDAIAQFQTGQDVGKIPKTVSKKAKKDVPYEGKPGVVYVGRVPHGFYEHEMRQYFSQFGDITQLRLSRNKRTGASKHFAFIQFAEETTAAIVAKTMDNYLLFGHILKCKVVPPERVHKDLWKGANRRFKQVPWNKMVGKELGRPVSQSGWERRVKKEERRRAVKAAKLKEIGYEFEAPTLKAIPAPAPVEEAPAKVDGAEAAEPVQVEAKEAEALPEPVAEAKAEEPVEAEKVEEPAPVVKATKGKKKGTKAKTAKAKA